jgi:hypothetical protein
LEKDAGAGVFGADLGLLSDLARLGAFLAAAAMHHSLEEICGRKSDFLSAES